jgi:hypothetical protein
MPPSLLVSNDFAEREASLEDALNIHTTERDVSESQPSSWFPVGLSNSTLDLPLFQCEWLTLQFLAKDYVDLTLECRHELLIRCLPCPRHHFNAPRCFGGRRLLMTTSPARSFPLLSTNAVDNVSIEVG